LIQPLVLDHLKTDPQAFYVAPDQRNGARPYIAAQVESARNECESIFYHMLGVISGEKAKLYQVNARFLNDLGELKSSNIALRVQLESLSAGIHLHRIDDQVHATPIDDLNLKMQISTLKM
jgi:hypothetical protein